MLKLKKTDRGAWTLSTCIILYRSAVDALSGLQRMNQETEI